MRSFGTLALVAVLASVVHSQFTGPGGLALYDVVQNQGEQGLRDIYDANCQIPKNARTCQRSRRFCRFRELKKQVTLDDITNAFEDGPDDAAEARIILFNPDTLANGNFVEFPLSELENVVDPQATSTVPFDPTKKTFVIMHGWGQGEGEVFVYSINILSDEPDAQVLGVVWTNLASSDDFFQPAHNAFIVGDFAGLFVSYLLERTALSADQLHVIGHGMACHGASEIARSIKRQTCTRPGRVTGLDCIKPYFNLFPRSRLISPFESRAVEVVHTNGGELLEGGIAFEEKLGDVDFYLSGGKMQPPCDFTFGCMPEDDQCLFFESIARQECSHVIVIAYYVESYFGSINFTGLRCLSQSFFDTDRCFLRIVDNMGQALCPRPIRGNYFMDVNAIPPFANGDVFSTPERPTRSICDQ